MNLWQDFLLNKDKIVNKWTHYFPIYERHFGPWQNKTLTFLEIGVMKGGSLDMWQRYFGPLARIVGIDIEPNCKKFEKPGVHVRIGDQSDPAFLKEVVEEFGVPDVVLDDGSHNQSHILASFQFLYPQMPKNGIYMVEDLHTAYWDDERYEGGIGKPTTFVNISKNFIDQLNADHTRGAIAPNIMTRHTYSICFYDSVIVFEKGQVLIKGAMETGQY
jgi:hypothetical protein